MMIRDTGGWVEFWFKTSAATYNNAQTWGWGVNGSYWQGDYPLKRGGSWQRIGGEFVATTQPVLFRVIGEGLGWPTSDLVADIQRGRVPDPPGAPYFGNVTNNAIHVMWDAGYDGGLPILEWQTGIAGPGASGWWNGRDRVFFDLLPGVEYLFFGRVRNERGWSFAGAQSRASTKRTPDAPMPPEIIDVSPTAMFVNFREPLPDSGGAPILQWQIGFGLDPNTPQLFRDGTATAITGLVPAGKYYAWARGRSEYGWGPWSGRSEVQLNAGVWYNDHGLWRRAIPWAKANGEWKIANGNIPLNGAWRVPRS